MLAETERLFLYALTPMQLRIYTENLHMLEEELEVTYKAEPMCGVFLDIVKNQADITEKDPDNYIFHTFIFLIRKPDMTVVGSADFKDVPDAEGLCEIGYGLGEEFRGNGYMTEAVRAMCGWADRQENIKHLTAETEKDNLPSQNVLKSCGFELYSSGETLWWRR